MKQKEYDVDNEPVFPICGTCNARKDSKPDSSLLLSDEKICSKILHCGKSNIETCRKLEQRCDYLYDIKSGIRAELDHLKGLGIVYMKVSCDECRDFSYNEYCGHCGGYRVLNIPLSDYKGEK